MIITALANYYEQLRRDRPDEVARPGWTSCKVKYQLVISEDGVPVKLIPAAEKNGVVRLVPAQEKKTSGVKANFLCNSSAYFFGFDAKGKTQRSVQCFEASKAKHEEVLQAIDSPVARAILAYYNVWDPDDLSATQSLRPELQDACAGGNLTFALLTNEGVLLCAEEDNLIAAAWDAAESDPDVAGGAMVCLATGVLGTPARVHPLIKGLPGAHPAGSSLVSFNAPAFESYGHAGERGRNAPVGEKTAQAYVSALNYLLSNRSHHLRMGDTTVVFWSERADAENTDLFSLLLGGGVGGAVSDGAAIDKNLESTLENMRSGKPVDINGVEFGSTFYVLGLAPNNARLAVRFFLKGEFGDMLANICAHYRRIELAHGPGAKSVLTPYWLLRAIENRESKNPVVSSELASPLIKTILIGGRYPEALFSNALLRVKATREVTYAQAAIIKAYLIRNCRRSEEEVTVGLNETRNDTAYNLGRAFSYLGQIQEAANGRDTLTGRYLDSACTRPAMVFPTLLKLSTSHLEKVAKTKPGWAIALERGLMSTLSEGRVDSFPKQLSLTEQGDFLLGYYHQKEGRYQKKNDQIATEITTEEA